MLYGRSILLFLIVTGAAIGVSFNTSRGERERERKGGAEKGREAQREREGGEERSG